MKFDAVYYEPAILDYPLGRQLREDYRDLPWIPIESHNSIREMQEKPNGQFGHMKRNLIAGIRKTHKYVENHKVSDYLVPYTSSGCTAMCLYCYLVCNYNKCAPNSSTGTWPYSRMRYMGPDSRKPCGFPRICVSFVCPQSDCVSCVRTGHWVFPAFPGWNYGSQWESTAGPCIPP